LYFFDSYAIIEVLGENPAYRQYSSEKFNTTSLNLAEVYYAYLLRGKEKQLLELFEEMDFNLIPFSTVEAFSAMQFRFDNKKRNLSFIDALGYTLAKSLGLPFLTGDKQFREIGGVEWVK